MNQRVMAMSPMDRLIGIEASIAAAARAAGCPRPYDIPFAIGWLGEMAWIAVQYVGLKEASDVLAD
jgi:hypothetical protein